MRPAQMHHAETLKIWSKSLKLLKDPSLELGLLHIPITSERIPELKKRIRNFQDEIIGWLSDESSADTIVQVVTYLMPFGKN